MSQFIQSTSTVMMIRPAHFGFNPSAAVTNKFSKKTTDKDVAQKAVEEFDTFVEILRDQDVEVIVIQDTKEPVKPDAVFSNNWISTWPDGSVYTYPMEPISRRSEKREDIIRKLEEDFLVSEWIDLSKNEAQGFFLEGTGAIVFDHENKIGFAALSPRCDEELFRDHMSELGYDAVIFHATDEDNQPIYHTNVMMAIQTNTAIVCLESIRNEEEKANVLRNLIGKQIVDISLKQMRKFAGNALEVHDQEGNLMLVLSGSAFRALSQKQKRLLTIDGTKLLPIDVEVIEKVGGGSVRCMITQIFLPKKLAATID